nr:peptidylprolyl isomerase [Oecophyllibacter saccharovorans]
MCRTAFSLAACASFMAASTVQARPHHYALQPVKPGGKAANALPDNAVTEDEIIAVVNGQILTERDVDDRARLFVQSTGLPISTDVMNRMRGQILHQLIDERLKLQEILRRHINIPPEQIAATISTIEQRNGMPPNTLRNRLKADGISLTTLIDQIRVQIGWMQVLRMELGPRNRVTAQQIAQREQAIQSETGRPQYFMSEIFIPVKNPLHDQVELAFTQTIINQLRNGAPFPIVAAQFSQDQTALEGGSLGWTQEDRLDPAVVAIVRQMPDRAISNPIKVPGGYVIATVHQRRTVGKQMGTLMEMRQVFFPFATPLNPQNPTEQQQVTLQKALHAEQTLHSCAEMEALNKSLGEVHTSNPGTQVQERLPPQMAPLLTNLPLNKPTKPLVSPDGITLLMVCSRSQRNLALQTPGQIADQLMSERIEQNARQLQRTLERQSVIQIRPAGKKLLSHG